METHAVIFYFDKNIHLIRLFDIRMIVEKRPTPLTWMALMLRECTSWVGEKKILVLFLGLCEGSPKGFRNCGKTLVKQLTHALMFDFRCFSDPFTREIMKEFHNTDKSFKDYKYAYAEPKESKTFFRYLIDKIPLKWYLYMLPSLPKLTYFKTLISWNNFLFHEWSLFKLDTAYIW